MENVKILNEENWSRYKNFRRYFDENNCSVSLCDDIDVTGLKRACDRSGKSFYISFLYSVSEVINSHEEFRLYTVDSPSYEAPMPAVFESVNPVHNIYREKEDTYVSIFTVWKKDFNTFYRNAFEDIERAKTGSFSFVPAADNVFEASCLPWRHFTSVGACCDIYSLSPMVVWGKYEEKKSRIKMPLSIQISHAACDGFHLARFLNEVEESAQRLAEEIQINYSEII